jgi:hypothetical protein
MFLTRALTFSDWTRFCPTDFVSHSRRDQGLVVTLPLPHVSCAFDCSGEAASASPEIGALKVSIARGTLLIRKKLPFFMQLSGK